MKRNMFFAGVKLEFFSCNWKELLQFKNTGAIREKFPRAKPTVEYIQELNFRFGIQTTLESGIDVGHTASWGACIFCQML